MSANRKRRRPDLPESLNADALLEQVNKVALGDVVASRTQFDAARFLLGLLLAEAGADEPSDLPLFTLVIGVPAPEAASEPKPGNGTP